MYPTIRAIINYYLKSHATGHGYIIKMAVFDLLFTYGDYEKRRITPPEGCTYFLVKVIGIFPFADDNHYIALEEENEGKSEQDLFDADFCKKLFPIKDALNEYLKKIKEPILQGIYLASDGRLIDFDTKKIHDGDKKGAKIRYQGSFKKEEEVLY